MLPKAFFVCLIVGGNWKIFHDHNVFGYLVFGQPAAAVIESVLGVQSLAGIGYYKRSNRLPPVIVWQPHHGYLVSAQPETNNRLIFNK
jgi:hypothetical protein